MKIETQNTKPVTGLQEAKSIMDVLIQHNNFIYSNLSQLSNEISVNLLPSIAEDLLHHMKEIFLEAYRTPDSSLVSSMRAKLKLLAETCFPNQVQVSPMDQAIKGTSS